MLTKKVVEFFAHQSGVDLEIAEREVVLTHALQLMSEAGRLKELAFKGGTCIRKLHLGATGRFSMDLDFTARQPREAEEVILDLMDAFNCTHHGITYQLDNAWRITQGNVSLTVQPTYSHDWNPEGGFDVQVSFRETPTLDLETSPQLAQSYFKDLPFQPVTVPCLGQVEVLSEKVRAAYQRAKVRDLHDLFVFSTRAWDRPLVRRLAVIKLWQVHDPFHPATLFERLRRAEYNWADLKRLLRTADTLVPDKVLKQCLSCYSFLSGLTEDEQVLAADAKAHKRQDLWEKLVKSCREKNKAGEF